MEGTYATVLTSAGAALVAESILTGKKLQITQAAVGDGGGAACRPNPNQTALAGERWRGGVAAAQQNSANPNVLDVKIVVGEEVGGFTIREAAIFNEAGVMVALCNTPETEKVTASGGASGKFTMVMHLAVADSSAVEVVVRPTLNTVSGEELEAALEAHEGSAGAHAGRLIPAGAKGAAGGVAELDGSGKVPSQQLPAMNYDAAGSAAAVQASLASHTGSTGNPHSVTKAQVGLPNVDNTSDASKPISTATQTALNLKAPLASPALTGTPTAPTAAAGTNTTQIATTAFVLANAPSIATPVSVANGGTGATTLTSGYPLFGNGTGAITATGPTIALPMLGVAYSTCATAAATAAKVVTAANYVRVAGGRIAVTFVYAVPAAATLNVNNTGAAYIQVGGVSIAANIINAGSTAEFVWTGLYWHLISADNLGLRVTNGSYIGTGTAGSANLNTLTFPFTPKIVMVMRQTVDNTTYDAQGLPWLYGQNYGLVTLTASSYLFAAALIWGSTYVSWYNVNDHAAWQLNSYGEVYSYTAWR